jgi:spore coat protein H
MKRKSIILITLVLSLFLLASCDVILTPIIDDEKPIESIDQETLVDKDYERFFTPYTYKKLTISLTIEKANDLQNFMLDHLSKFNDLRSEDYVASSITYEDSFGSVEASNIGFRTRGNVFSRRLLLNEKNEPNKNHFKLKFNAFIESSNRFLFGLEEIDLKYNKNQDETYINEYYPLSLYESMGVLAQRKSMIDVFIVIDDMTFHMGIYLAFEPIDSYFIARRFIDEPIGDLYKVLWQQFGPATLSKPSNPLAVGIKDVGMNYRPTYDLKTNKRTSQHEHLLALFQVLSLSNDIRKSWIESHDAFDYLARYFAVSFLLGNPDDFRYNGNNFYLYFPIHGNNFYIIPYDLDHSLGSGWDGAPAFSDQLMYARPYDDKNVIDSAFNANYPHPLLDTLLSSQTFKDLYKSHILTILNDPRLYKFSHIKTIINRYSASYGLAAEQARINLEFGFRDLESYLTNKEVYIRLQL